MNEHRILPKPETTESLTAYRRTSTARKLTAWFLLFIIAVLVVMLALSRLAPTHLTGRLPGPVGSHVNVSNSSTFTCDTTLQTGTILKSFPCITLDLDREEFLENLSLDGANVGAMFKYAPTRASKWEVYNGSLPNYTTQTLNAFGRFDGVYFVMTGSERFVYLGYMPEESAERLRAGWNLIGYPSTQNRSLGSGLSTINTSYTVIKTLEGSEETGAYLVDTPPPGGETLTTMEVYHGYWINLTSVKDWTVES